MRSRYSAKLLTSKNAGMGKHDMANYVPEERNSKRFSANRYITTNRLKCLSAARKRAGCHQHAPWVIYLDCPRCITSLKMTNTTAGISQIHIGDIWQAGLFLDQLGATRLSDTGGGGSVRQCRLLSHSLSRTELGRASHC